VTAGGFLFGYFFAMMVALRRGGSRGWGLQLGRQALIANTALYCSAQIIRSRRTRPFPSVI
jgi:hypothetical protein